MGDAFAFRAETFKNNASRFVQEGIESATNPLANYLQGHPSDSAKKTSIFLMNPVCPAKVGENGIKQDVRGMGTVKNALGLTVSLLPPFMIGFAVANVCALAYKKMDSMYQEHKAEAVAKRTDKIKEYQATDHLDASAEHKTEKQDTQALKAPKDLKEMAQGLTDELDAFADQRDIKAAQTRTAADSAPKTKADKRADKINQFLEKNRDLEPEPKVTADSAPKTRATADSAPKPKENVDTKEKTKAQIIEDYLANHHPVSKSTQKTIDEDATESLGLTYNEIEEYRAKKNLEKLAASVSFDDTIQNPGLKTGSTKEKTERGNVNLKDIEGSVSFGGTSEEEIKKAKTKNPPDLTEKANNSGEGSS